VFKGQRDLLPTARPNEASDQMPFAVTDPCPSPLDLEDPCGVHQLKLRDRQSGDQAQVELFTSRRSTVSGKLSLKGYSLEICKRLCGVEPRGTRLK